MQGQQPRHRSDLKPPPASDRAKIHHQRRLNLRYFCPAGHLFDLSALTKVGGYTVHDHRGSRKMFRINVCGSLPDAGCGPNAGACISPALLLYFLPRKPCFFLLNNLSMLNSIESLRILWRNSWLLFIIAHSFLWFVKFEIPPFVQLLTAVNILHVPPSEFLSPTLRGEIIDSNQIVLICLKKKKPINKTHNKICDVVHGVTPLHLDMLIRVLQQFDVFVLFFPN